MSACDVRPARREDLPALAARVGFRETAPDDASPELRALRAEEPANGQPVDRRVLMTLGL